MAFYQAQKAKYPCSVNDVIVRACARAIMEFPAFRSRIEGDEIVESPSANIGIAVGMDEGLVVPVVIGAERMTLQQIGAATQAAGRAARGGKIEGMGQGVFTITNLGMFGVGGVRRDHEPARGGDPGRRRGARGRDRQGRRDAAGQGR